MAVARWLGGGGLSRRKNPKNYGRARGSRPPPLVFGSVFFPGVIAPNGGITPNLQPSRSFPIFVTHKKNIPMKMNLKNSIYQSGMNRLSENGLSVQGGRLINHGPSQEMGITSIANSRKAMKRENKIQMQAEAYLRGEQMNEAMEMLKGNGRSCD